MGGRRYGDRTYSRVTPTPALNGGNIGQAFTAGIIGGAIGAASGFLNFAAGSTSFTGIGATIEKAAKHAFVDVWMGGVKNAVYGGELSPLRDAIGGALSSVGNGFIHNSLDNTGLKVAASAVLGGTISEIGGGKFANGAVTGAYSMLFNELMHPKEDKTLKKLRKTKNVIETVSDAKKSVEGDRYAQVKTGTRLLQVLKVVPKILGQILSGAYSVIDGILYYEKNIAPVVNRSLESEGATPQQREYYERNEALRRDYERRRTSGYWDDNLKKWVKN